MLLLSSGLNGSPKERGHVSPSPQSRAREYEPFRGLGVLGFATAFRAKGGWQAKSKPLSKP